MSSTKIITYDLDSPGQNYTDLINAIEAYPNCVKLTESCWAVKNDDSCVVLRDALLKYIDNNDRIFVAKLSGEAAWKNIICDSNAFKDL